MIRLTYDKRRKFVSLDGNDVERSLFYFAWQSSLWPKWLDHEQLGRKDDTATKQHRQVLYSLQHGRSVLLACPGAPFTDAIVYAVERVELLGVNVELVGFKLAESAVVEDLPAENPGTENDFDEGGP